MFNKNKRKQVESVTYQGEDLAGGFTGENYNDTLVDQLSVMADAEYEQTIKIVEVKRKAIREIEIIKAGSKAAFERSKKQNQTETASEADLDAEIDNLTTEFIDEPRA